MKNKLEGKVGESDIKKNKENLAKILGASLFGSLGITLASVGYFTEDKSSYFLAAFSTFAATYMAIMYFEDKYKSKKNEK